MLRSILLLLLCNTVFAQEKLKRDFSHAKNDSLFAAQHGAEWFRRDTLDLLPGNPYEGDSLYEILTKTHAGEVTGPIRDSAGFILFKTISFDSSFMACMTFVRVDSIKNAPLDTTKYQKIMAALRADTTTLRSCCKPVQADHRTGLYYNWGVLDVFDPPVAAVCRMHKCNDVFAVSTQHGTFVIRMISDPVQRPVRLRYVVMKF